MAHELGHLMPKSQKRRQSVVAMGSIYSKHANAGRSLLSLVHSGCRATAARRGGWLGEESGSYPKHCGGHGLCPAGRDLCQSASTVFVSPI